MHSRSARRPRCPDNGSSGSPEAGSPEAGRKLADVSWPLGSTPAIVLRGHRLRPPQLELTLTPGNRVSLLTAVPDVSPERDPGGERHAEPAGDAISHHP